MRNDQDRVALLSALVKVIKPARSIAASRRANGKKTGAIGASLLVLIIFAALNAQELEAEELPLGLEIMRAVAARAEGPMVSKDMRLELTDRRGQTRAYEVKSFYRYFDDDKRTILPTLRKVGPMSAPIRGDYFRGTDFSYEEIKGEKKVSLQDYRFHTTGQEEVDGILCFVIEGTVASAEIAAELGYSKTVWLIDPAIWISRKSDYWDANGNHLKTIENLRIENVDGIWTVLQVRVKNYKTAHSTLLTNLAPGG